MLYSDDNQNHDITLHDSRAEQITLHNNILTFHFPEGFYLGETHALNPFKTLAYTGESEMKIRLLYKNPEDNVTVQLSREEYDGTRCWKVPLQDFMKHINNGFALEFYSMYQGIDNDNVLFIGSVRPQDRECMLMISTKEITYHWNALFPEDI